MSFRPSVYVSSTFEDLKGQRARVLVAVAAVEATAIAMENYGARDRAALLKCVEDVRKSNLYVGIIGWRYGHVPEGSKISITEAEYEAAEGAGIPKLIYLASDTDRPSEVQDGDPVCRFRERASKGRVRRMFKDDAELATFVTSDLAREVSILMATNAAESLLPYLCDRDVQTQKIALDISSPEGAGPPICLLHGTGNQSPLRFLDCLRNFHLPECLGRTTEPAQEIDLAWPVEKPADVARTVRLSLARSLALDVRKDAATLEDNVRKRLGEHPGPVLITCQAPELTSLEIDRLRAVVAYFKSWPRSEASKPDLVVFSVVYPVPKPGMLSFLGIKSGERREQRLRAAVASIEQSQSELRVLPELSDVRLPDASRWTRSRHLQSLSLQCDLESQVREIFDSDETVGMPMAELAPKLLELLTKAATRSRP